MCVEWIGLEWGESGPFAKLPRFLDCSISESRSERRRNGGHDNILNMVSVRVQVAR